MKIGFIGLGKMGQQMVKRLLVAGHEVVALDVDQAAVEAVVQLGAIAATDRTDLIQKAGETPVIWLMIPAQYVDNELDALQILLPSHSVLIDGGNSDFRLTLVRAERLKAVGISLVDVGTSGGVLGERDGFSMMIGGETAAVQTLSPLFEALAHNQGWKHFGPAGAGHYIKMVHNAIEYGLMESYAEGYRMLKDGPYGDLQLGAIGEVWENGSIIASLLNRLTADILKQDPTLEQSNGIAEQSKSSEAIMTLEVAAARNISLPAVQAAVDVRLASQNGDISFATKLIAAQRHAFGGHQVPKS
ncbi:MAG: NADP-dependent phosphogluconate dehydrogenase [Microcoleus sp.]